MPTQPDLLAQFAQAITQEGALPLSSVQFNRLTVSGRVTITGRVVISDFGTNVLMLGTPRVPPVSFTIPTDYDFAVRGRLSLAGAQRATVAGTARIAVSDDFGTRSRIVLAGSG